MQLLLYMAVPFILAIPFGTISAFLFCYQLDRNSSSFILICQFISLQGKESVDPVWLEFTKDEKMEVVRMNHDVCCSFT